MSKFKLEPFVKRIEGALGDLDKAEKLLAETEKARADAAADVASLTADASTSPEEAGQLSRGKRDIIEIATARIPTLKDRVSACTAALCSACTALNAPLTELAREESDALQQKAVEFLLPYVDLDWQAKNIAEPLPVLNSLYRYAFEGSRFFFPNEGDPKGTATRALDFVARLEKTGSFLSAANLKIEK